MGAPFIDPVFGVLPVLSGNKRMVLVMAPATSVIMSPEQMRAAANAFTFAAQLAESGEVTPLAGGFRVIQPAGEA